MAAKKKTLRYGAIRADGSVAIPLEHEDLGAPSGGRIAFRRDGRWGFLDHEGKEVIPPEFDFVWPFAGGAAAVERGGTWISIGLNGETLDGFRGEWSEGRASFTVGKTPTRDDRQVHHGDSGYVDTDGNVIAPASYKRADPFRNGHAVVQLASGERAVGETAVIDRDGTTVVGPVPFSWGVGGGFAADGWCRLQPQGVATFYGTDGGVKLATTYPEVGDFSDDLAPFTTGREDPRQMAKLHGYLARDGSVAIEPRFREARPFHDGLAQVSETRISPKFGVIDRTGAFVVEPTLRYMHPFHRGAAPAAAPDGAHQLWGVLGSDGAWRHDPAFAVITTFREGLALFRRLDNTTGMIDTTGRVIMDGFVGAKAGGAGPTPFTRKGKRTSSGAITGAQWGLFGPDGGEVVPCRYAEIGVVVDGLVIVGNKV